MDNNIKVFTARFTFFKTFSTPINPKVSKCPQLLTQPIHAPCILRTSYIESTLKTWKFILCKLSSYKHFISKSCHDCLYLFVPLIDRVATLQLQANAGRKQIKISPMHIVEYILQMVAKVLDTRFVKTQTFIALEEKITNLSIK